MEATTNNYCVWSFNNDSNIFYSVFRYNQTYNEGTELANKMTDDSDSDQAKESLRIAMPDVYNAIIKQGWKKHIYFCTKQKYGIYGESLGPFEDDINNRR